MKPRRVQITAPNPIGAGYFKHGQYAYVVGMCDDGGMYWIDKPGASAKGETAYLISKTKEMAGGALWISEDGIRFTGESARAADERRASEIEERTAKSRSARVTAAGSWGGGYK